MIKAEMNQRLRLENVELVARGEEMGVIRDPSTNSPFIPLRVERASAKMIQSGA